MQEFERGRYINIRARLDTSGWRAEAEAAAERSNARLGLGQRRLSAAIDAEFRAGTRERPQRQLDGMQLRLTRCALTAGVALLLAGCGGNDSRGDEALNEAKAAASAAQSAAAAAQSALAQATSAPAPTPAATLAPPPSASPSPSAMPTSAATTAPPPAAAALMPNLIGTDLQTAQDTVQRVSGNPLLFSTSRDVYPGKSRIQILDRDWQVCTQDPAPGAPLGPSTSVDFGVVRAEVEDCP